MYALTLHGMVQRTARIWELNFVHTLCSLTHAGLHQKVIFGRLPSNDIVAEHASISRQHCALSIDMTGVLLLTDLGSGDDAPVVLL